MAPNAMIGELRNCFESAPGASFRGGLDVWTAGGVRNGGGGACGWEEKEGGEGEE